MNNVNSPRVRPATSVISGYSIKVKGNIRSLTPPLPANLQIAHQPDQTRHRTLTGVRGLNVSSQSGELLTADARLLADQRALVIPNNVANGSHADKLARDLPQAGELLVTGGPP